MVTTDLLNHLEGMGNLTNFRYFVEGATFRQSDGIEVLPIVNNLGRYLYAYTGGTSIDVSNTATVNHIIDKVTVLVVLPQKIDVGAKIALRNVICSRLITNPIHGLRVKIRAVEMDSIKVWRGELVRLNTEKTVLDADIKFIDLMRFELEVTGQLPNYNNCAAQWCDCKI